MFKLRIESALTFFRFNIVGTQNYIKFSTSQKSFPTAAYINNLNTLFEPSHSIAHSLHPQQIPSSLPPLPLPPLPSHSTVFLPEPTYEFRPPNFYPPNLYTDPLHPPYVYPPVLISEQQQNKTSNEKMHKWWSFHSIKEKVKSFFKHSHSKDETQNPVHGLENQQQLWPGNFFYKIQNCFHESWN